MLKLRLLRFSIAVSLLTLPLSGVYAGHTVVNSVCVLAIEENPLDTRVSINVKNATLTDFLNELKKACNDKISFIYASRDLEKSSLINFNEHNVTIKSLLDKVISAQGGMSYSVSGNIITIKKKEQKILAREKLTFTGNVFDEKHTPIAGATAVILGTTTGTVSDNKGQFTISANEGDQLEISFLGMQKQQFLLSSKQKILNITLQNEVVKVEDVVVTGIFQRVKTSYTGSATTVTAKELKQFGNKNILVALRNLDPSLNIIENNISGSNPNNPMEIQIRGNSSLPNVDQIKDEARDKSRVNMNTPLVILDGFETTLQQLIDMNENEIESLTILKDASATAIYGSRGANGVIVVLTKAPQQGKLRVSYRGDLNIDIPDLTSYSLLNARQKLELEKAVGIFNKSDIASQFAADKAYNTILNDVNNGVDTYWMSKPLRVSVGQRHNLRVEGGDNTFRYSASVQYNDIQGVMKKSLRNNTNANINLSYRMNNLKFSNNLQIGMNSTAESPYGSFKKYVDLNPYYKPYDENGALNPSLGPNIVYWKAPERNPLIDAQLNTYNKTKTTSLINNFSIEWEIAQALILKGRIGLQKTDTRGDEFYPAEHSKFSGYPESDFLKRGEYTLNNSRDYRVDASVNLTYSKLLADKHMFFAGVDYNIRENASDSYGFTTQGYTNQDIDMISMGRQFKEGTKPMGAESISRAIGITGSFNYTYDRRYYADFSIRSDGNSAFGSNRRFANFWAAGLGWNIHNEKFMNTSVINQLKIRSSVGINGSQQFNSYQALSTMKYYTDDIYGSWVGAYLMGLGNKDLKWQQKMNYNIGVDAAFFNNRLSVNLDAYKEITQDLISSMPLPMANGFDSYIENVGKVENKGIEVKVTGALVRNVSKGITWSLTGSLIHNKNKIVKISDALKTAQKGLEADNGANPNMLFREGYSENTIWVMPSLGIDPSNGKEHFMGANGKPTYNWNEATLTACGTSVPKYQGSINTSLRYRKFLLSLSFGYRFGGQQYNSTLIDKVENANYYKNLDSRVYTDRWLRQDQRVQFKSIHVTSLTQKTSRFVQDENTLTCQNINASYEFDSDYLRKNLSIENLSLAFSMSDLFYLSTIKRERGTAYPFSRQMSLTMNITF